MTKKIKVFTETYVRNTRDFTSNSRIERDIELFLQDHTLVDQSCATASLFDPVQHHVLITNTIVVTYEE